MLFQILFEHEFLTTLPREHFFPWCMTSTTTKPALHDIQNSDSDLMYLVKIKPRKNLFNLCAVENLPALWYFVKQNCVSRKSRIIPRLE